MGTAKMYVEYSCNVQSPYAKDYTLFLIGSWFIL